MGETGKLIVSIAGLALCFEIAFGLILWWQIKRTTIRLRGSWFRILFDVHTVLGIYTTFFLLLAAATGVVIGFGFMEKLIFKVTHSEPLPHRRLPNSTPFPGANPISVDQAMAIARKAMPEASVATIQLPSNRGAAFHIGMRVLEEASPAIHSFVSVDQYSGQVLWISRFKDSLGYRVIRFNRSLHTGDIWGFQTHVLVSLSSLVLVMMVLSGISICWKKLG